MLDAKGRKAKGEKMPGTESLGNALTQIGTDFDMVRGSDQARADAVSAATNTAFAINAGLQQELWTIVQNGAKSFNESVAVATENKDIPGHSFDPGVAVRDVLSKVVAEIDNIANNFEDCEVGFVFNQPSEPLGGLAVESCTRSACDYIPEEGTTMLVKLKSASGADELQEPGVASVHNSGLLGAGALMTTASTGDEGVDFTLAAQSQDGTDAREPLVRLAFSTAVELNGNSTGGDATVRFKGVAINSLLNPAIDGKLFDASSDAFVERVCGTADMDRIYRILAKAQNKPHEQRALSPFTVVADAVQRSGMHARPDVEIIKSGIHPNILKAATANFAYELYSGCIDIELDEDDKDLQFNVVVTRGGETEEDKKQAKYPFAIVRAILEASEEELAPDLISMLENRASALVLENDDKSKVGAQIAQKASS